MPVMAMDDVTKIEKLNTLVFLPQAVPLSIAQATTTLDINEVCTNIQKGHNVENEDKYIEITRGIVFKLSTKIPSGDQGVICIYVPGYSGMSTRTPYKYAGSGAYSTFNFLKAGIMPKDAVCVSFDLKDELAKFNFGQELDQGCLNTIYEKTIEQSPRAKVVLFGSCRGATLILNYLTNPEYKEKNFGPIKAIVLESPAISLDTLTDQVATSYLYGNSWALRPVFSYAFSSYKWGQKTMIDNADNFPSSIPALVGYFEQDKLANPRAVEAIVSKFKDKNKNIEGFKSANTQLRHSQLSKAEDFQEKARSFLGQHVKEKTE